MNDLSEAITRLETRLDTLEERVSSLEHPRELPSGLPTPTPPSLAVGLTPTSGSSLTQAGATFAVLGKAMLGMAGAYVLRAVAESGSFPKLAVIALAIAYAGMWLVWAAIMPARQWFAATTYAATSALILVPMLWELTLRFHFLSPAVSAAVLAAVAFAAYALAWKRNLSPVVWVTTVAATVASTALLIATHDMMPFIAVLLLMALLTEIASTRNRWLRVRPLVAIAADVAIYALLSIYSSPESSRTAYPSLTTPAVLIPALLLFLIYSSSIALRTVIQRQCMTRFEIAQAVLAFLLAADAIDHFPSAHGMVLLGAACLLLAPGCYAAAFLRFDRALDRRNDHVYSTWAGALFLTGCFLCLPAPWLASCLGMAAIAATLLGVRFSRLTLEFHGLAYLIGAAIASDVPQYAAHALAGVFPPSPAIIVWIILASAVLCYAGASQQQCESWQLRLFQILSAAVAVVALATGLLSVLVWLTATVITPGRSHVAVLRTLTGCALSLAMAWFGPRWRCKELVWIAYAMLLLVAAKLLLEDLQQGHPEFIAASIFLYAVTLIIVPRLVRRSTRDASELTR